MFNKYSKELILFGGIVLLVALLLQQCNQSAHLKAEVARHEQNERALLDTVTHVKNRAGELQAERSTFIATERELRDLNAGLAKEVDKQKGRVLQLTQANAELRNEIAGLRTQIEDDPVIVVAPGSKYPRAYRLKWAYDTTFTPGNYTRLSGFTRVQLLNDSTIAPGLTDITENAMGFRLVTGLKKEGEDYRIFIKSDHPGFTVSDVQGAVIPGRNNPLFGVPKKWSLGVTLGPNVSIGYGINGPSIFGGLGVTFGLNYEILKLF